jgi:hypothetical protein
MARGPGLKRCDDWTAAFKNTDDKNADDTAASPMYWLYGFISGVNATRAQNGADAKISADQSPKDLMQWMDKFCADHPNYQIASGADILAQILAQWHPTGGAGAEIPPAPATLPPVKP